MKYIERGVKEKSFFCPGLGSSCGSFTKSPTPSSMKLLPTPAFPWPGSQIFAATLEGRNWKFEWNWGDGEMTVDLKSYVRYIYNYIYICIYYFLFVYIYIYLFMCINICMLRNLLCTILCSFNMMSLRDVLVCSFGVPAPKGLWLLYPYS